VALAACRQIIVSGDAPTIKNRRRRRLRIKYYGRQHRDATGAALYKPIRHVVCAGALGWVNPIPGIVPLNEL